MMQKLIKDKKTPYKMYR